MYRHALDYLKQWSESPKHKPIVIRGARQVGKSTLVHQLAKEQHLSLVELDFERKPELAELFISNEPEHIIMSAFIAIK